MPNYFSKNLKFLREKKKLQQQELADEWNIPRSTLSCWETGIRTPSIEQIQEIARYFGVDIDIVSRDYSNLNSLNDETDLLFDKYKDVLTESDKSIIKTIIEERKKKIDKELGDE